MKTVLAPGVGWPSAPQKPEVIKLQRGGKHTSMTRDEVLRMRQMRKDGKSLEDMKNIFRRGKATLIAATFGRGAYEGY